jgi:hypothetical protein
MKRALLSSCALVLAFMAGACGDNESLPTNPGDDLDGSVVFVVDVVGERFNIRVTDPTTITLLRQRLQSGRVGVIIGRLASGSGGFNTPWSWHLDPATVQPADLAVEVCDGRPSDIEGNLSYWLGTVKNYCPWGATVVQEQ